MSVDEPDLRTAAEDGDAEAMVALGVLLEQQARERLQEARRWFERAWDARSLDGLQALIRLAVADSRYSDSHYLMQYAEQTFRDAPRDRLVSIAPDVLGRTVSLDGDDADDVRGAGTFTVISPYPERAAAAVARVAPELLNVDEHGVYKSTEEWFAMEGELPYTPNYVFDTEVCHYGARVQLDTKGVMWSAMGRTMVGMLVGALAEDAVVSHITGYRPDLDAGWREWTEP